MYRRSILVGQVAVIFSCASNSHDALQEHILVTTAADDIVEDNLSLLHLCIKLSKRYIDHIILGVLYTSRSSTTLRLPVTLIYLNVVTTVCVT